MRGVDLLRERRSSGGALLRQTVERTMLHPADALVHHVDRVSAENPAVKPHPIRARPRTHVRVLVYGGVAVVDADEKDGILSRRRCLFRPGGEFGGAFYQERSLSLDERQNRAGTRGILTVAYRDVATPIA